jgi:hypothetical protein
MLRLRVEDRYALLNATLSMTVQWVQDLLEENSINNQKSTINSFL